MLRTIFSTSLSHSFCTELQLVGLYWLHVLFLAGPGLVFTVYSVGLALLPAPKVWSVLFFATLLLVGFDTQVNALWKARIRINPWLYAYRNVGTAVFNRCHFRHKSKDVPYGVLMIISNEVTNAFKWQSKTAGDFYPWTSWHDMMIFTLTIVDSLPFEQN